MKYETELDLSFNNTMTIFIDQIKENSTVLEFGPASGRLTRYLKEKKNCSVYIVEIDEEAGKIAAKAATDYVIGDILDYEWKNKFEGVTFDYILFADVLEHLTDATSVLKVCRDVLKEDGKICLSVPNIGHNSVIINLLKNQFRYTSTGIMDNTHVHFYTKESVDKLVEDSGLFVEKRYATYTQVGKNEFENSYEELYPAFAQMLKTRSYGEVYQYVYVAGKKPVEQVLDCIDEYADYEYAQFFVCKDGACDEVSKVPVNFNKKVYSFELTIPTGCEKLRIDPVNNGCIIKSINVIGVSAGKETELSFDSCNAEATSEEGVRFFLKEDPILFYCLDNGVEYEKIIINIEFEAFLGECSENNKLVNSFKKLVKEINNCNNTIAQKDEEIRKKDDEIFFLKDFTTWKPVRFWYKKFCNKYRNGQE